jgi:hypothetical protein
MPLSCVFVTRKRGLGPEYKLHIQCGISVYPTHRQQSPGGISPALPITRQDLCDFTLTCLRSYTAQAFILSLSVYFFLYLNAYCLIRVAADIKELAYLIFTPQLLLQYYEKLEAFTAD